MKHTPMKHLKALYHPLTACILCRSANLVQAVPLAPIPIATPTFAVPEHLRTEDAFAAAPLVRSALAADPPADPAAPIKALLAKIDGAPAGPVRERCGSAPSAT